MTTDSWESPEEEHDNRNGHHEQDGSHRSMLKFVMALTAAQYQRLEPAAREIFGEQDADWFLDVSERTARDYITALKHFYL